MFDLLQGDCLDVMPSIPDHSIDLILCDLPHGLSLGQRDRLGGAMGAV
jgi:DNA modification methylase